MINCTVTLPSPWRIIAKMTRHHSDLNIIPGYEKSEVEFMAHKTQLGLKSKDLWESPFWSEKWIFNSHHTREFTPHHTSWFSTTKGLDFERMARDRENLTTWGDSSYHYPFDPTQKLEFPFFISGRADFKSWTSGLSWYHQKLRNLISGGVPWRIFGIGPR